MPWRRIQLLQNPSLARDVVAAAGARARRIGQAGHALRRKPVPPLAHGRRAQGQLLSDAVGRLPVGGSQHDARAHDHALLAGGRSQTLSQRGAIFWRQHNRRGWTAHAASLRINVELYK